MANISEMYKALDKSSARATRFEFVKRHILNCLKDTDNRYSDFALETYIQHHTKVAIDAYDLMCKSYKGLDEESHES